MLAIPQILRQILRQVIRQLQLTQLVFAPNMAPHVVWNLFLQHLAAQPTRGAIVASSIFWQHSLNFFIFSIAFLGTFLLCFIFS